MELAADDACTASRVPNGFSGISGSFTFPCEFYNQLANPSWDFDF